MTDQSTTTVGAPLDAVKTFLSAVLAGTEDPFTLLLGEAAARVTTDLDDVLAKAGGDDVYLVPVTATGAVPFLYSFTDHAQVDQWQDDVVKPTAVLFKDGGLICAYALETAVHQDAEVDALAGRMNGYLDEPVPTPGANGWKLIHLDADTFYPLKTLADAWANDAPTVVAPASPWEEEDHGTLNDARLLTPFRMDVPAYAQSMTVSLGSGMESKRWKPEVMPVATFVDMLSRHKEDPKKDGFCFVLAEILGDQRKKTAVKTCYGVGLDIDVGVPGRVIDEALAALGCLAVRYTTHSHGKTKSQFPKDRLVKWFDKNGADLNEPADFARFLREAEQWDEALVASAEYIGDEQQPSGLMSYVTHAPFPKHRVVLPLAEAFEPAKAARTHADGMKMWGQVCYALAARLDDLPFDKACIDPSRLFYFPRHAVGKPYESTIVGGKLLNWRDLDLGGGAAEQGSWEALLNEEIETTEKTKSKSTTEEGRALGQWSRQAAGGFQIVELLRDHADDRIRTHGSTKIDIECPFDEEHSNAGDPEDRACFAVNAGDGTSDIFTIKCQHDGCRDRTNLDHLGKMITDGWFPREAVDDPGYHALLDESVAPKTVAEMQPTTDSIRSAIKALPPKDEAPDPKPVLDMIARLDDRTDRETLLQALKARTGAGIGILRSEIDRRRAAVKVQVGGRDNVITDPKTGFRTFTYTGDADHRELRACLVDTMNLANKAADSPIFTLNRGQVMALRRHDGKACFEDLTARAFRSALFEYVSVAEHREDGGVTHLAPEADICGIVMDGLKPGELPEQPSIRRAPTLGDDGRIMDRDGWYNDILVDLGALEAPNVPLHPTDEDAKASLAFLLTEVLSDFPFDDDDEAGARGKSEGSQANALAMLLTQFFRSLFKGPSPLFAIVKPNPGAGGTLMAEVPQILFDGFASATTANSRSDEEMEKLMSSAAMGNESFMFFDNVRSFNSDTVKRTCTSTRIGGRKLGSSLMVSRPNDMMWQINGINPVLGAEMTRRSVFIRLNTRLEHNGKREYRHKAFKEWLEANRSVVIGHILTLGRAWWVKGHKPSSDTLQNFESWAGVVGGILENAGVKGFLSNAPEVAEDREGSEVKDFMAKWWMQYPELEITEKIAFDFAEKHEFVSGYGDERRRRFGELLDGLRGRAFDLGHNRVMFGVGEKGGWCMSCIGKVDAS